MRAFLSRTEGPLLGLIPTPSLHLREEGWEGNQGRALPYCIPDIFRGYFSWWLRGKPVRSLLVPAGKPEDQRNELQPGNNRLGGDNLNSGLHESKVCRGGSRQPKRLWRQLVAVSQVMKDRRQGTGTSRRLAPVTRATGHSYSDCISYLWEVKGHYPWFTLGSRNLKSQNLWPLPGYYLALCHVASIWPEEYSKLGCKQGHYLA